MATRFLFFVPFLSPTGPIGVVRNIVMFAGVCLIYFLRARTEENHLSRYPEYVRYADLINERGLFRFLRKPLPFLRYSEERAKAGRLFR